MNIKTLFEGYINKLKSFNGGLLSTIVVETLINPAYSSESKLDNQLYDTSEFMLKFLNDIIFEKTEISLQSRFLFIGDKILYNSEDIEINQNEFNNYLQSQVGYILSDKWRIVNKPSNADKNLALLWIGRFNFEKVQLSYSNESLTKLCTRNVNLNIKLSVPTLEEKQLIFNNMLIANSPIIKKENGYYDIINVFLASADWYIDNGLRRYSYKPNSYKLTEIAPVNYTNGYIKINDLTILKQY